MLFHQRERQRRMEVAEAQGKALWTTSLEPPARHRLRYALSDLRQVLIDKGERLDLYSHARRMVLRDAGLPNLAGSNHSDIDVPEWFLQADRDIVFSILEASRLLCLAGLEVNEFYYPNDVAAALKRLDNTIATVLRQHRVSFDLLGNKFVAFESREMHMEVTVPALTLLGGEAKYRDAEVAYQEALSEIGNEKPDNAITDAARALEITLGTLGCSGNTLGKKLTDARERGLFGDHDSQLREAMMKIGSWVAADRAQKGDAHPGGVATLDDAWLIVHVVGALILRLARTPARGNG